MKINHIATQELEAQLKELLAADPSNLQEDQIREIAAELKLRDPNPTAEQLAKARALYDRIYLSDHK